MDNGGERGLRRSADGRIAALGAAEYARATRRGQGTLKKPRLSSEGVPGEQDRRVPSEVDKQIEQLRAVKG